MLDNFIKNYKNLYKNERVIFDGTLMGLIKKSEEILLDEKMSPSKELKEKLLRLKLRAKEAMRVAIVGQFSSGKSTFLNALLSKNVLPTGITPVTSKVNFIRYGEDFKIKINYSDGREEFQSIENIPKFVDQRQIVEEIEFLTLYVPLELLKVVEFVDTPGLNSQSKSDTSVTKKVLKEVDGIIWLSLIDNAGKLSEAKILQEYLSRYKNKCLCVLNQKDRFEPSEVEKTKNYIKSSFSEFFSEVIAISAKEALISRSHDKNLLIHQAFEEFIETLKEKVIYEDVDSVDKFYEEYKQKVRAISSSDLSKNIKILKNSNIEAVLEFINTEIKPIAHDSKEYAIKHEIKTLCSTLIEQHMLFLRIYDELIFELNGFEKEANTRFDELKIKFSKKLKNAYEKIEEIIDTIANEIFKHTREVSRVRYRAIQNGFLKKRTLYEKIEYKAPKIDSDMVYRYLFYDDEIVEKKFKKYVRELKEIQDEVNENNTLVYEMLKQKVQMWQSSYEYIRKSKGIYSDVEFANMRKFASKAYENILKSFSDEIHISYAKISSQFNHLSSAINFNYRNATEVVISFIERRVEESVKLYESNPAKFSLYQPTLDEIKDRLKITFYLYELENMMNSNSTFLSKNYDRLSSQFYNISASKKKLCESRKIRHYKTIEILKHLANSIA